jgi:phosphoribosyl 1,2-cyclic phosphodiesterase
MRSTARNITATAVMASEIAASAETGELVLFHHDPAYIDDLVAVQEETAQKLFPDSRAAYEGFEIKLNPAPIFGRGAGVRAGMEVKYVEND